MPSTSRRALSAGPSADPIERYRTWLLDQVDMTESEEDEIAGYVKKLLNDSLQRAEESPCQTRRRCSKVSTRRRTTSTRPTTSNGREDLSASDLRRSPRGRLRRDDRVFVLGEDIGVYGGAFKVTLGFQEEFGSWRVIDMPLSDTAIVAGATGAAIMGMRPVAEMISDEFDPHLLYAGASTWGFAWDRIAAWCWMSERAMRGPRDMCERTGGESPWDPPRSWRV